MKGLLHSKRFKTLLRKWLLLYVGVIALLTTVVTYSKYMTSITTGDMSRVSRFEASIIRVDEEKTPILTTPEATNLRTTGKIDYYFMVDTRKLEVKTNFYLTFNIHNNFTIEVFEIKENSNEKLTLVNNASKNWKEVKYDVNAGEGWIKYFKVTAKSISNTGADNETIYDIVKVGFVARQDTSDGGGN